LLKFCKLARLLFIFNKLANLNLSMKNSILIILLIATATLYGQSTKTLPDLVLKDVNGKQKNLSEYSKSGKITVISFWATWCSPCKKELNNVNELYEDWHTKYGVEVVAVSTDNARNVMKVKPYVDGQAWPFDVLLDVNEDLKRAMNVVLIPHTFLVDRDGKIVYSHSGYVEGDEFQLENKIKEIAKQANN